MRVLCLYSNSYGGGTEAVLRAGLPFLTDVPGIKVCFRDLYSRAAINQKFENLGISVSHCKTTDENSILSFRSGFRRKLDVAAAVPRHLGIAISLRGALSAADVLYLHGYKDLALCQLSRLMGGQRPRPMVLHCHGLGSGRLPPMMKTLANCCVRVIAISEDVKNSLVSIGVKQSIIRTVHNAVDHARIQAAANSPVIGGLPDRGSANVILTCPAAIRADKGIHLAIDALNSLPQRVHLWITGDKSDPAAKHYLRQLLRQIENGSLQERVHFVGLRSDLPAVMRAADVICVPSICREGFALVAAEAMALGKPVVASCRGALPEVVGESGLIFDPDKPGDLAQKLAQLTSDSALAAELGASARQAALQRFTYERWARDVAAELCFAVSQPGN